MEELAHEIVRLQTDLDREIEHRRKVLGWAVKGRLVQFEQGLVAEQRALRTSVAHFLARSAIGSVVSAPIIYSMIIPLVLIDLWTSLYQAICFRAYSIPRVRRADYIALDRSQLGYLNWIEALNCSFCGYGNGVIAYVREVASRTEQYWCPIKHALRIPTPHDRYISFLEYGDAEGYRGRLEEFRDRLQVSSDVPDEHPSVRDIA
nr:hypothetical protein [Sphingobium sp. BYY-5]